MADRYVVQIKGIKDRHVHVINSQVQVTTNMNQELIALSEQVDSIDEGTRTTFVCVDEDLITLDQCIDHCFQECERTDHQLQEVKDQLRAAEDRILALEESKKDYRDMLLEMRVRIEAMEGQLCHCGKGKGKEVEVEGPLVLGSPLILDRRKTKGTTAAIPLVRLLQLVLPRLLSRLQPSSSQTRRTSPLMVLGMIRRRSC